MITMTETSFVPGWMIGVPLLIVVGLLVWRFIDAMREEPDTEEKKRPLFSDDDLIPPLPDKGVDPKVCSHIPICPDRAVCSDYVFRKAAEGKPEFTSGRTNEVGLYGRLTAVWDSADGQRRAFEALRERRERHIRKEAEAQGRPDPLPLGHTFMSFGVDVRGGTDPDKWTCAVIIDSDSEGFTLCGKTYYEHIAVSGNEESQ